MGSEGGGRGGMGGVGAEGGEEVVWDPLNPEGRSVVGSNLNHLQQLVLKTNSTTKSRPLGVGGMVGRRSPPPYLLLELFWVPRRPSGGGYP